ncbi:MAG: Crp/Fnr family transcriptional regulator [Bacteroidota bacterium]
MNTYSAPLPDEKVQLLRQRYQALFESALLDEIVQIGTYKSVPKDHIILDIGDLIAFMPLVLNGSIKILREDEHNHELLLYYLEFGDTCAMTLNCCMRKAKSQIRATTEQDTELIMVPVEKMETWVVTYPSWRTYVFDSYNIRLNEMLESIDTLAFMNMEERLLRYLRDKALINQSEQLQTTHQEIANDLHTSRVVVSRILKKLEKEGKIQLHRNMISIPELL